MKIWLKIGSFLQRYFVLPFGKAKERCEGALKKIDTLKGFKSLSSLYLLKVLPVLTLKI